MNLRSEDIHLSEILNLVIQRRRCNFIRDCQEGLLKSVIFNAGNLGMDVSNIVKQIYEKAVMESFPKHIVEKIIEALYEKGELRKEGDNYFLSEEEFKRIAETIKKRRETLEKVESEIAPRVGGNRASHIENSRTAIKAFRKFISIFLSAESRFIADIMACQKDVHELVSPAEILDTVLSVVKDESIRKSVRRSLTETLRFPNRKFLHILYEAVLNLVCLRMLSIDPSGSFWKKHDLSEKTFILDTNVLLALILPDHPQHAVTSEIVSITKRLGVNFVFTKRTMLEWIEVLEKANQRFRFLNSARPSLLGKVEDIFIYSYFKRKETNPSLMWREYYSQMKQIENLAHISGIHLWKEKEEYISDVESSRILEHLSDEVYRSGRKRLDARFIKSSSVSEHDAYHLLLVRRLREEESPLELLGPSYWFLTYDVSLLEADKALNMLLKSPHAVPSSLLMDTWVLMSSLFLDSCIEKEKLADIFADLFRTYFATPFRGLSASMIVEVLSPYLSYKSLSDDDLKAVLEDNNVKWLYFELREARSIDPERARLIYDELHQRVNSIVWRLLENRTKEAGIF